MRREWAVVCLGESYAVVVAAWEVPAATGSPTYEAVISTHRGAATAAPATSAVDADPTWLRALAELDPPR